MQQENPKLLIKYLRYKSEMISGEFSREWEQFLKNSNVNFYTSRKDTLWFSIRGKGYVIWIHGFYPGMDGRNGRAWFTELEILRSAPQAGMDVLQEFIDAAVEKFGVTVLSFEQKKMLEDPDSW